MLNQYLFILEFAIAVPGIKHTSFGFVHFPGAAYPVPVLLQSLQQNLSIQFHSKINIIRISTVCLLCFGNKKFGHFDTPPRRLPKSCFSPLLFFHSFFCQPTCHKSLHFIPCPQMHYERYSTCPLYQSPPTDPKIHLCNRSVHAVLGTQHYECEQQSAASSVFTAVFERGMYIPVRSERLSLDGKALQFRTSIHPPRLCWM